MIWILLAVLGASVAYGGARVASRGADRARAGEALVRESSTLEYQLAHEPRHVIIRVKVGRRLADSGMRIARRGLWVARLGVLICAGAIVGTLLDITT